MMSTPVAAMRSFVRAFEKKRWDVLLRFVPDAEKGGDLTAEKLEEVWDRRERDLMTEKIDALRNDLERGEVRPSEGRALFVYSRGTVVLALEHGIWKIEDF